MKMKTQLIALEVPVVVAGKMRSHIEAKLSTYGDPLRWAIVSIDATSQTAQIEAVVSHTHHDGKNSL